MTRKQKTIGVAIAVAVLAAAGISYAVASSGSSSTGKQVVVLSTVQRRTLQGTVNLTGTLARKEITKVTAATQGLVSDVSVKDGAVSKTGDVMFSLNGRNAIAESGTLPFFRSLVPGDSGADVVQLKQILNAAGDYAGPSTNNLYTRADAVRSGTVAGAAELSELQSGHHPVGERGSPTGSGLRARLPEHRRADHRATGDAGRFLHPVDAGCGPADGGAGR